MPAPGHVRQPIDEYPSNMTRRRKSWFRTRNVAVGLSVVLIAVIAYRIYWTATAEPAPVIDYAARIVELCESAQPDGDNGWPLLTEAAAHTVEVEALVLEMEFRPREEGFLFSLQYSFINDWGVTVDIEPERVALRMLRERGAFDLMAEAARRPRMVRPVTGPSPLWNSLALSELSHFRTMAQARAASMRLAFRDGDTAEGVAAFEQTLALARACGSQADLIDHLTGMAIGTLALDHIRHELMEGSLDAATCRALLDALDRQLPLSRPHVALEGERAIFLDMIQWMFTDDGHGDGRLDVGKFNQFATGAGMSSLARALGTVRSMFVAGRAETTRLVNEFYDGLVAESKLSPLERSESRFDADLFTGRLATRHLLLELMIPAAGKFLDNADARRVTTEGFRIMVGLAAYQARHAAYPDALDRLAPEFLAEVPVDPTHGGPFRYRLLSDDPHRRPYLLYSTGIDQIDDRGVELDEPGHWKHGGWFAALVDPNVTGVDFVINRPRPKE